MIGRPWTFPLMFLDELALKVVVVDEGSGTRLRRTPMSMSSSCWGKRGGDGGGEISRNGARATATGGGAGASGAGASGSNSYGKLEYDE